MATKVDNTASQLCRAHGCSLEATMDRLLDAEKRVAELEAAIWAAAKNLRINNREPQVADFLDQVLTKGQDAQ